MIGKRYGRLVVLEYAGVGWGKSLFTCKCDCGRHTIVVGSRLRSGNCQSCGTPGCRIGTTHGLSKMSRAYVRWKTMKARCQNPKSEGFHRYGAKGIQVCERWHTFENFLADMGEPPIGTVLDRVEIYGDYCPQNCRWATFKQSTQNRSNTVWIGNSRVNEVAELYSIPAHRVRHRLLRGWTLADIVKHPHCVPHGFSKNGVLNPSRNARLHRDKMEAT